MQEIPKDHDAERRFISALMRSGPEQDRVLDVLDSVTGAMFHRYSGIAETALQLARDGRRPDQATLEGKLDNLPAEITEERVPPRNLPEYAEEVREAYFLRRQVEIGSMIVNRAYDWDDPDEIQAEAENSMVDLGMDMSDAKIVKMADPVAAALEEVRESDGEKITGIPSGLHRVDDYTRGFQHTDLVIIAGRPSMGKTALALECGRRAGLEGTPVGIISLEMSAFRLGRRILFADARVEAEKPTYTKDEEKRLARAAQRFQDAPIYIIESGSMNVNELNAAIRRLSIRHGVEMVIVDFLQQLSAPPGNWGGKHEWLGHSTSLLKGIAKERNLAVLALAQLNRSVENRSGDNKPQLSDLRASGNIEEHADQVLFLYREEYYEEDTDAQGEAEIHVAKNRSTGKTGRADVAFIKRCAGFDNLARDREEGDRGDSEHWSPDAHVPF